MDELGQVGEPLVGIQAQIVLQGGGDGPRRGRYLSLKELMDDIAADPNHPDPKVAFVIAGGGATGAYEAGMIDAYFKALSGRTPRDQDRLRPALIVGTSAGALNAVATFIDQLGLGHPAIPRMEGETLGSAVWRAIGARNRGARFVVDWVGSWLFQLTARLSPLLKSHSLLSRMLALPPQTWWPQLPLAALVPPAAASGVVLAPLLLLQRAIFRNRALSCTLANLVKRGEGQPEKAGAYDLGQCRKDAEIAEAGARVVAAWEKAGDRAPELIVTATDLTARREALFTLVQPETFRRLVHNEWATFQIGGRADDLEVRGDADFLRRWAGCSGATDAEDLIRCVIASTSIPAVFPSQRIRLHAFRRGGETVCHDFVDGGALNNAPVHIAIDAGATHVISLELEPLCQKDSLERSEAGMEPFLFHNLLDSFMAMLSNATAEDLRKAGDVNEELLSSGQLQVSDGDAKRVVHLYRTAPSTPGVGLVDFNGHYDSVFWGPSIGLVDWLDEGRSAALNRHVFWDCTRGGLPMMGEQPPDVCELCEQEMIARS